MSKAATGAFSRWGLVVAIAPILWGAAFPGIKLALRGYGPIEIAILRILLAAAILALVALFAPIPRPRARDIPLFAAVGILGFPLYQILTNLGLQSVPAGTGSLLVALVPLLAAIFAWGFYRERIGRLAWLGLPLAIAGVYVIVRGHGGSVGFGSGFLPLLGATIAAGAYFALEKRLLDRYDARAVLTYTLIAGAIAVLPLALDVPSAVAAAPVGASFAVVLLAIFPTIVAFGVMAWGLSKAGTLQATSAIYLIPVAAFVTAWPLLGERPIAADALGGALCLAGVWLVNR